jgi:hypothetical protein
VTSRLSSRWRETKGYPCKEDFQRLIFLLLNSKTIKLAFNYDPCGGPDCILDKIFKTAPDLQSLEIESFDADACFKNASDPFLKLKYLKLLDWKFTDEQVKTLVSLFPNTENLMVGITFAKLFAHVLTSVLNPFYSCA